MYPRDDEKTFVRKIIEFHEGIGYDHKEVKRYLGFLEKEKVNMIVPSHGLIVKTDVESILRQVINAKIKSKAKAPL